VTWQIAQAAVTSHPITRDPLRHNSSRQIALKDENKSNPQLSFCATEPFQLYPV